MEHHVGPKKRKRFRQMLKEEMSTNAHVGQEKYVVVDKSKSSDTVKGSKESTNTEESIEGTKKKRRRQKKGKKLSKQDSVKLVEPTVVVDEGNVSPFKSQIEESENVELVTSANGDDNTSRRREKTTKKENHALGTADVELRKSVIVPDPIGVSTNADDDAGCLLKFVGQQSTSDGKNRILNKKEKANRAGSKRRRAKKGGISVSRLSSYGL